MNEELELIVQRMMDAGESEEAIAEVIQTYNAPAEPAAPVKKKEATESPSTLVEDDSLLDGSTTDEETIPVSPIKDIPDQLVDQPIADLYEKYKEAGKIKPDQVQAIQQKLEAQEEGDRGFWETALAMTEGYITTGFAVPVFQYDNKEDLVRDREEKNKVDFLSELPEETVAELKSYAGEKIADLESSNLNVMAENKMLEEKGKTLVNQVKYHDQAITQLKAEGKPIPAEAVAEYQRLHKELTGLSSTYNKNFDLIENNVEDIGDFYEEVNLLKKNYGGLDYYKDMTRLTTASMMAGVGEFALSTRDRLEDKTGIAPLYDAPFTQEDVTEFRAEIARQQEYQKPAMSVTDIGSMGDFGAWLGEQVAMQLPVITTLVATGGSAGLGIIGASSAGQKIGELEDRRTEAKVTLAELEGLLETGEFSEEELNDIERTMAEARRAQDITDDEMYLAGLGTGALEVITERVTLGILSKGKRAFMAAKKAGGAKEIFKGVGRGSAAGLQEGGAEFVNAFGGNLIDVMYLNDPNVHVFDDTIDALASGTALGFGMRTAPAAVGMGAKAFMKKDKTAEIKKNSRRIADIQGEIEVNGENMGNAAKELLENKVKSLKKAVAKDMRKAFDDVSKMPKEDIQELIDLDKKANKLMQRIGELKKSNINKEMKQEFILDLKAEADAIIAKKQEILDKKHEPKQETPEVPEEDQTVLGKSGKEIFEEEGGDTSDSGLLPRPDVRLKKIAKGKYFDNINEYTVQKTKEGNWQVVTKPYKKTGKDADSGTVLTEAKTLKEATAYIAEQTGKRDALLEEATLDVGASTIFEAEGKKSKFNWKKLLGGVPIVSYVDELVFSRASKAIEDKVAEVGNRAFTGKIVINAEGKSLAKRAGAKVINSFVAHTANVANSLYKGSVRSDVEIAASRKLEGYQERAIVEARQLTQKLSALIESDKEAAKRVHQALDPEIYDETVKYEDLTENEQALFDSLRAINQATHEANFKNGFISKETFDKYDGKYIGRGYEVHEGLTEEAEREVFIDSKIFGKIYSQRQEVNQWIIDNTVNDPIYLTMNRMARTQRNIVVKEYADFVSEKYGVAEKPETGFYTQLNGKAYGKLNGKWVPNNVAEDFKGYFFNNKLLDALHQAVDMYNQTAYKQFMKRWHTVYSPLVQVGNLLSNHAFAFASGINVVQLYRELPSAYNDLKNKEGDYENILKEGLIGSNVLDKDLQLSSDFANKLSSKSKGLIGKIDKNARRAYSGSDNAMKMAAYKAQKRLGYNHEEAIQRVYEGFQNYASVGKIWDLASKLPVWGSDYVKFQGDLNRIVKNAVTKRPMTTISFLYGLSAVAGLLSRMSGEEEAEREIREDRQYIPKITTFFGDFPLVFRVGDKEVNLARYVSPYYKYDKGSEHWAERLSQYSPINLNVNEDTGTVRVVPSDVATGSIWAAFMDNKDFRNKIISDPNYNIYTGSTASTQQKLTNRVLYVLRSQIPLFSFGHDLALSAAFEEDYYGRDKSPTDILLSRIVKIQTWDSDTTKDNIVKALKGINYEEKKLKTKRSSISNKYDREIEDLETRLKAGGISQEAFKRKSESLASDFESRSAALAEKEAKVQERFNNLKDNTEALGVSFRSVLSKAKRR